MEQLNQKHKSSLWSWLVIPLLAVLTALCYEIFIFPNAFAPAGIGGLATMVQHYFGFDAGYLNLLINVPLLIFAYFYVDREFVFKSAIFTAVFSSALLILSNVDFSAVKFFTPDGNSRILAPIAGGFINGALYGYAVRKGGSTGGTDVIAACVRQAHPEYALMWIGFVLNTVIAVMSFFVYDFKFEPVICCILYCFTNAITANRVLQGYEAALKYEIITSDPEALAEDLLCHLHHGVTVVPAEGMYTHEAKSLVICVVNKHQIVDVQRIIAKMPGTFAYISSVSSTVGNFRRVK